MQHTTRFRFVVNKQEQIIMIANYSVKIRRHSFLFIQYLILQKYKRFYYTYNILALQKLPQLRPYINHYTYT